jgi:ribulose 1,5-bisphosphate synthetase/thiazole synthase
MTFLGGMAGTAAATANVIPKWLHNAGKKEVVARTDKDSAVDVLVVGGGVQGLVLLNVLEQEGYSAALGDPSQRAGGVLQGGNIVVHAK